MARNFFILFNFYISPKTDYEKEDEVALYDSFARKWVRKRVQVKFFNLIFHY